ncbi:proliferating cell nuclear antigen (pcna) [Candidatus Micrarchaeota archaeon CG1_02_55_22]|nr:MAG: proliferating cell nuclear antigen (pcna) [Candidatus Micrarchaeota archaeon CG1_02_55_22]
MELVIEDARFFKSCIDAIANLVDEGNFEVSDKGVHLRSMDPSQIAMIDFSIPKDAFASLDCTESVTLGIGLVDFGKVLARTRAGEKLTISLEEKENKFVLEFAGDSKRRFKMPLLDLGSSSPKEPGIPFDASVKVKGGSFKDMIRDAGLLSSHVILSCNNDNFVVEARGDSGELVTETQKGAPSIVELSAKNPARAMFPYEYLDDMTRACPDDAVLSLDLKTDAPVRLSYDVGKAKLAYYLAPRVENI